MRFAIESTNRIGRTILATAMAFALCASFAMPTTATALPADPSNPEFAPALTTSPKTGTVDGTNTHYYNKLTVADGDYVTLDLSTSSASSLLDMALYAGTTSTPFAQVAVSNGPTADEYISWLVPPGAAGDYTVEINTVLGAPSTPWRLDWSKTPVETPRLWGMDRYETSYAISRGTFASATTAVVASGADFPDALAASGLAGVFEGPVLLTKATSVPAGLIREIVRLGVDKIYVIGGPAAVSDGVYKQLSGFAAGIERVSGSDRYQTATRVAEEIWRETGSPASIGTAFVVRGDEFADALAVSPLAYTKKYPVLLTKTGALNSRTQSFLSTYNVGNVVVAGGEAAVSSTVVTSLSSIVGSGKVSRWSGSDRYATAKTVAQNGVAKGWLAGWDTVGVATGISFPDALSGGVSCGAYGGPLLLTKGTSFSTPCRTAIVEHDDDIDQALLFGGEAALSAGVASAIGNLIP